MKLFLALVYSSLLISQIETVVGRRVSEKRRLKKGGKGKKSCDPKDVQLSDYPQWREEEGYWIGEYSFFGAEGDPYVSAQWNYPYDHYKGFITGNINGNAYRQRNVFLYPPQTAENCSVDNTVAGAGVCGTNGNTRMFEADQSATTCSNVPGEGGTIEGPYAGGAFYTKTTLVGEENALLYQVFYNPVIFGLSSDDVLNQSQLTTIVTNAQGQTTRVRTAQGFGLDGSPTYASFYRETKVTKEKFYEEFKTTLASFNILESDTCEGAGFAGCESHFEESFLENWLE